ncbi:uncharacterized protein N7487_003010 [Penicillium crustosum]|uniref:uncharacterized protein n=1 Tax=Penicillium crustosum TaxID=36656 RepID=UPI0023A027B4|nr:uncharacterized protein N7487_003010 [Penicillium crustosum]KAJ5419460.1 hypothetical protein N7487_003010 [Penicillium crustosum]
MIRTSSSEAANALTGALRPQRRFEAPLCSGDGPGAKCESTWRRQVRRSTDRLTCEVANQGQKGNRAESGEGKQRRPYSSTRGGTAKGSAGLRRRQIG